MFKLSNNYNMFEIEFIVVKNQIKGSITMSTVINEMTLRIAGFTATFCDIDSFFCLIDGANNPDELFIGQNITIDGVEVKITSIDSQTFQEYNDFWEEVEMNEMNDF